MSRFLFLPLVLLLLSPCYADLYTVTTTADSGGGSLREAIELASARLGPDTIVFDPSISGGTISVLTPLPPVTNANTDINGDTNGDGKPDIMIMSGSAAASNSPGLAIREYSCWVRGLSICGFSNSAGLQLELAGSCVIRRCHLGVNLAGTARVGSNGTDLLIMGGVDNQVGGTVAADRCVLSCTQTGLELIDTADNTVVNTHFGVKRNGNLRLPGTQRVGLKLSEGAASQGALNTRIGPATASGLRNIFGPLRPACLISGAATTGNIIRGNYFGLGLNGSANLAGGNTHITVTGAAHGNVIGQPGVRNVFANATYGVWFDDAGTDNTIRGNVFGTDGVTTTLRPLQVGVGFDEETGGQRVGGDRAVDGNSFHCTTAGIWFCGGAGATVVDHNKFGVLPNGTALPVHPTNVGIDVSGVRPGIASNTFQGQHTGILVRTLDALPIIVSNSFRNCWAGVHLREQGLANLGVYPASPGLNTFASSLTHAVYNETAYAVAAEGNTWGSQVAAVIDGRIYDELDDPSYGRVDYVPLKGGVIPTAVTGLALSATAAPAGRGAEIVVTLAAPARVTVEVLNLAGRVVAVPLSAAGLPAGTQRVIWSGATAAGTAAPAGQYLVRVRAAGEDGAQAERLSTLLRRR